MNSNKNTRELSPQQRTLPPDRQEELLGILKKRFEKNMNRHKGLDWADVQKKLEACLSPPKPDGQAARQGNPEKLWVLDDMEETGGEPDVVGYDKDKDEFIFFDCSAESPKGRRSLCYDHEALESRKEHKPADSAINMAATMGIKILTEDQYRELQKLGQFDAKTSSWVETPAEVRKLGGAIFGDYRFGRVFFYHNGAESYYAARGFRGSLRV